MRKLFYILSATWLGAKLYFHGRPAPRAATPEPKALGLTKGQKAQLLVLFAQLILGVQYVAALVLTFFGLYCFFKLAYYLLGLVTPYFVHGITLSLENIPTLFSLENSPFFIVSIFITMCGTVISFAAPLEIIKALRACYSRGKAALPEQNP